MTDSLLRRLRWLSRVLRATWLSTCTAAALGSCSHDSSSDEAPGVGGAAGLAGSAGAGGTAGSAGAASAEPGWRELPRPMGELPVADLPSCGPGCRIVLGDVVVHPAQFWPAVGSSLVADANYHHVMVFDSTSPTTSWAAMANKEDKPPVLPAAGDLEIFLGPYVSGRRLAFEHLMDDVHGQVDVVDFDSKQVRSFGAFTRVSSITDQGVPSIAMDDAALFWMREGLEGGLFRADLVTGETRRLTKRVDECDRFYATASGVVCGSVYTRRILRVDTDSGLETPLDDGGALQVDLAASPDRTQVVWVDYRDPPGASSSYDGQRSAGEIYLHDIPAGSTERVTLDSSSIPRGKVRPSVDGDLVIWLEPCSSCDPNPKSTQELYASEVLVRFDRKTNQRCRLEKMPLQSRLALRGHKVYGYWIDPNISAFRLGELDLDAPGLDWSCS
jgi:hypothetical protein